MPDQPASEGDSMPNQAMSESIANIAEQSQRLINNFVAQQGAQFGMADPKNIASAFLELTSRMMADPAKVMEAQMALWQSYMELWQAAGQKMMGQTVDPVATPDRDDRRFRDRAWDRSIRQPFLQCNITCYLLYHSQFLHALLSAREP